MLFLVSVVLAASEGSESQRSDPRSPEDGHVSSQNEGERPPSEVHSPTAHEETSPSGSARSASQGQRSPSSSGEPDPQLSQTSVQEPEDEDRMLVSNISTLDLRALFCSFLARTLHQRSNGAPPQLRFDD